MALSQRALAIRERALGPNHPDTATSLNNLAALYEAMGQFDLAEVHYKRALAIYQSVLGSDHLRTIATLGNLALNLVEQGRTTEATRALADVMPRAERHFGMTHPKTLELRAQYDRFIGNREQ